MKDFFDTWKFKSWCHRGVPGGHHGLCRCQRPPDRRPAGAAERGADPVPEGQRGPQRRRGLVENYARIDDVMDQNEQLEAENAELRQQMVDYDRIKAENDAYKALARIQDKTRSNVCLAFVIGRDPLD